MGLKAEQVTAIEARVPQLIARLIGRPWLDGMSPAYARLCLPFLVALMLTDGHIDPRRFTPENFADEGLRAIGRRLTVIVDDNPDPNALSPQTFIVDMADGTRQTITVPATLGSPINPLTPAQHADKLAFARSLSLVPASPQPPLAGLTGRG
jgi:2-methylcitrate dehydratase PrpD